MILVRQQRLYNDKKLYVLNYFRGELHHRSEAYRNVGYFEILKALCPSFEEVG